MPLHLLKMCVGINDVDHLVEAQGLRLARLAEADDEAALRHLTRNVPRRWPEIVDGGSIYWVIRGFVRVRQRIVDIERLAPPRGGKRCALVFAPELVRTELQPRRPHQGWRYLEARHAPADLSQTRAEAADLPTELAAELRHLGLL